MRASWRCREVPVSSNLDVRPPRQDGSAPGGRSRRRCPRTVRAPFHGSARWENSLLSAIVVVVSLILFGVSALTLWWMVHAWRTPETLESTRFSSHDGTSGLRFSLLVPARHEEQVLAHTVTRLLQSRHPDFEIIVIVGHDDPGTTAVAEDLAARHANRVRVVVDHNERKNKPTALNTALPDCRGDVVGVFDAEDEVHPELLRHVDHAFRATGADVVQGGVQLINFHSSWYSLRNCLEYYFWFRSRLHLHAEKGFIPLGGNTVFVRTDVLRAAGGWDGDCLAEDCDLGVRLSSSGSPVVVVLRPGDGDPGGDPGLPDEPVQAADPLEPGLPPGVPEGGLEAAAGLPSADAGPLHPRPRRSCRRSPGSSSRSVLRSRVLPRSCPSS